MTEPELCRENILHTYLALAGALPDVEVVHGSAFDWCLSEVPLALCNFAINFHAPALPVQDLADELFGIAEKRPVFRIFLCDGDHPPGISNELMLRGMTRYAHLASMICDGDHSTDLELQLCETDEQRDDTAAFMVSNFFWRRESFLRNKIVESTARSPHRLYRVLEGDRPIAAVMLSETSRTCGLYNLCVESRHRNRGIGSQVVRACAAESRRLGKVLTLQSETNLANWYMNLGFREAGRVETIGLSTKSWR